ncbi:MAG: hypothetical protein KAS64_05900 [Spirochaetes bacterium]|nr:hypothetical protein [Spirochaetota bacterium]
MRKFKFVFISPIILLFLIFIFSACNMYDFTHSDGESDDMEVLLGNADAAWKANDYDLALNLYKKAIDLEGAGGLVNSRARIGYSSVILYKYMELSDIPILVESMLSIDSSDSSNSFLTNQLTGPQAYEISLDIYLSNVTYALSNSVYYRAPVFGIDPATGIITTDGFGIPYATNSDGLISSSDRGAMLNYLIIKAVNVALSVQESLAVAGDLIASIDSDRTNDLAGVTDQASFTVFHVGYTNYIASASNAVNTTGPSVAADLYNLADTAQALLNILSNDGINPAEGGGKLVSDLKGNILNFAASITNISLNDKISNMTVFQTNLEVTLPYSGWMGY